MVQTLGCNNGEAISFAAASDGSKKVSLPDSLLVWLRAAVEVVPDREGAILQTKLNDTKLKASLVIILCLLMAMFGGVLLVAGTDTLRSRLFLLAVWEPKEQEEFELHIYSGLSLTFDPSRWTIGRTEHGKWLESTAIADCRIGERGPSSTPPDLEPIRLGEISYDRFEYLNQEQDRVWSVHYARDGFENPAPDYTPMIIVSAPEATIDQCRTVAEDVLKTLH